MYNELAEQLWKDTRGGQYGEFEKYKTLNLADGTMICNDVGRFCRKDADGKSYQLFSIKNMGKYTAVGTEKQIAPIEQLLKDKQKRYSLTYLPPHYLKGQGNKRLVYVSYEIGVVSNKEVHLLDYGGSYGKIIVEGIEVTISHSGGTLEYKNEHSWEDYADDWHMVGEEGRKALVALIN